MTFVAPRDPLIFCGERRRISRLNSLPDIAVSRSIGILGFDTYLDGCCLTFDLRFQYLGSLILVGTGSNAFLGRRTGPFMGRREGNSVIGRGTGPLHCRIPYAWVYSRLDNFHGQLLTISIGLSEAQGRLLRYFCKSNSLPMYGHERARTKPKLRLYQPALQNQRDLSVRIDDQQKRKRTIPHLMLAMDVVSGRVKSLTRA